MRVPHNNPSWRKARGFARSLNFGGVRGRMANVDSADRMKFIHDNFEINHAAWVGGRFICRGRKLLWENGKIQKTGDYTRSHSKWYLTQKIRCSTQRLPYMPLLVTAEKNGFYWRASGPNKVFDFVLVEFPTGKK